MSSRPFAFLVAVLAALCGAMPCQAAQPGSAVATAIDAYLRPYADTGNFSGVVRVERAGRLVFEHAYGFADRQRRLLNTPTTRFHVASVSMQFTAAAIMRLVDRGDLALDTRVGAVAPDLTGFAEVTVRDLLEERSGVPDINARDDYGDTLKRHQTPRALIGVVAGQPLLFLPGAKFLHEEHSAYNLLALLIETKTGKPFAQAMQALVFRPLQMERSGVDDDAPVSGLALGDQPKGVLGLEAADAIHWSAKAGNGSAYVTAADQARWVSALFHKRFLSRTSSRAVLNPDRTPGYGWFKTDSKRFGERTYSMNGRAPGFASFVLYLPKERLTVVAFSNIYSSATTTIGNDIADTVLGRPAKGLRPVPLSPNAADALVGASFHFGAGFYQPNITLTLVRDEEGLGMQWAPGSVTPLIPTGEDTFVDRAYWTTVRLRRDGSGRVIGMDYDGFPGERTT